MHPNSLLEDIKMEDDANRVHSGSVSPPAPVLLSMDSMNGKKAFFETMRTRYADGRTPKAELETKIEQLWRGLSQTQKEQFILKSTSKTNIPLKSPVKKAKPRIIQTETCKAIAKVLDLHGDSQKTRFADTVKKRMQAYSKNMGSRVSPPKKKTSFAATAEQLKKAAESIRMVKVNKKPSNSSVSGASGTSTAIATNPEVKVEISDPPTSSGPSKPPQHPFAVPKLIVRAQFTDQKREKLEQQQKSLAPGTAKRRPGTIAVRVGPRNPNIPRISYQEACRKYYDSLSQATLVDPVNDTSLPRYAEIVEGWHVAKEYTFSDLL